MNTEIAIALVIALIIVAAWFREKAWEQIARRGHEPVGDPLPLPMPAGKARTVDAPRLPKPGEMWRLGVEDPFEPKHEVKILDVKSGRVRYYNGPMFPDDRMKLSTFVAVYGPPVEPTE